ncbi:MAG: Uncharacterized MFS-type transporter, partial [uncultured Solirubrobacteraceae bacterium]
GLLRGGPRRDGGQRRPAGDQARPRRRARRPAVGRQRLPARARLADPHRRLAGRHLRRAAHVQHRRGRVRPGVRRLRGRALDRAAGGGARPPRRVRGTADPERARGHRHRLPAGRAGSGHRLVDRLVRDRHGGRPAGGRLAGRRRLLALDLRDQRPLRAHHPGHRRRRGAGPGAEDIAPAGRLAGRAVDRAGPRRAGAGAHPPAGSGLELAAGVGGRPRRPGAAAAVPRARGPHRASDAAPRPVPAPQLRSRQCPDAGDVRRTVRGLLPPRRVPAAGRRLRRVAGGPGDDALHPGHVRPLQAGGSPGRPLRPAPVHGWGAAGRRGRHRLDGHAGRRRRLLQRAAAGPADLLDRPGGDGGAAHRDGAGRRRGAERRHRVRRQQRRRPCRRAARSRRSRRAGGRPVQRVPRRRGGFGRPARRRSRRVERRARAGAGPPGPRPAERRPSGGDRCLRGRLPAGDGLGCRAGRPRRGAGPRRHPRSPAKRAVRRLRGRPAGRTARGRRPATSRSSSAAGARRV